jgi:hypothetical protein
MHYAVVRNVYTRTERERAKQECAGQPQQNKMVKYIVVSGGVVSGLGKGVIASSCGRLLRAMGFSTTALKIDPYLNIDAGTMSPFEHGEVFVLDDGGEVDLDLGNYERFVDLSLSSINNITTGKIYQRVISNERQGNYLGKTVQVCSLSLSVSASSLCRGLPVASRCSCCC